MENFNKYFANKDLERERMLIRIGEMKKEVRDAVEPILTMDSRLDEISTGVNNLAAVFLKFLESVDPTVLIQTIRENRDNQEELVAFSKQETAETAFFATALKNIGPLGKNIATLAGFERTLKGLKTKTVRRKYGKFWQMLGNLLRPDDKAHLPLKKFFSGEIQELAKVQETFLQQLELFRDICEVIDDFPVEDMERLLTTTGDVMTEIQGS